MESILYCSHGANANMDVSGIVEKLVDFPIRWQTSHRFI